MRVRGGPTLMRILLKKEIGKRKILVSDTPNNDILPDSFGLHPFLGHAVLVGTINHIQFQ